MNTSAIRREPVLTRLPSMRDRVQGCLSDHKNELVSLFSKYLLSLPHHLLDYLSIAVFFILVLLFSILICSFSHRYVSCGRCILQPHEILSELQTLIRDYDGVLVQEDFSLILQAAQVISSPLINPSLIIPWSWFNSSMLLNIIANHTMILIDVRPNFKYSNPLLPLICF